MPIRWCIVSARFTLIVSALLISGSATSARAHDVITSTVTFNREIRAIFEARCNSCHRSDGAAFPLTSYADARPWAKAIEEEVLTRRMPPWGAVPGYGEFRNDPTLTMTEMQQIAEWAEGGAPEGDPVEQPASPLAAAPVEEVRYLNPKEMSADGLLDRAVSVDALKLTSASAKAFKLMAELPGGNFVPLLWVSDSAAAMQQVFQLRTRLQLPAGTAIRGLPPGASVQLLSER